MSNHTTPTVGELSPAIGQDCYVLFEQLTIACRVADVKTSYGRVRLLVTPLSGSGSQWVELGRLVRPVPPTRPDQVRESPETRLVSHVQPYPNR